MTWWWMLPGWKQTRCHCGSQIWPEGDPDWGECYECFSERLSRDDDYPEEPYPEPGEGEDGFEEYLKQAYGKTPPELG